MSRIPFRGEFNVLLVSITGRVTFVVAIKSLIISLVYRSLFFDVFTENITFVARCVGYVAWKPGFICTSHTARDEIESKEHRQREEDVHRNADQGRRPAADRPVVVESVPRRERRRTGHRMHGADQEFDADLQCRPPRQRDPPVIHAVLNHKQLYDTSQHDTLAPTKPAA